MLYFHLCSLNVRIALHTASWTLILFVKCRLFVTESINTFLMHTPRTLTQTMLCCLVFQYKVCFLMFHNTEKIIVQVLSKVFLHPAYIKYCTSVITLWPATNEKKKNKHSEKSKFFFFCNISAPLKILDMRYSFFTVLRAVWELHSSELL